MSEDEKWATLNDESVKVKPNRREVFADIPVVPKPDPPPVGTAWLRTHAMWSDRVKSFKEYEEMYIKKAKKHEQGLKFLVLDNKTDIINTSKWNYSRKKFRSRWSAATAYAKHICRKDADGNLKFAAEWQKVHDTVQDKVIVYRDAPRVMWAHVMYLVGCGYKNYQDIVDELNRRFAWDVEDFAKQLRETPGREKFVREQWDSALRNAHAKVYLHLGDVRKKLQLPPKYMAEYTRIKRKLKADFGAIEHRRRDKRLVVKNAEMKDLSDFVKTALVTPHPMRAFPCISDDEWKSAFLSVLKMPERLPFFGERKKLLAQLNEIVFPIYETLLEHRPKSAVRVSPHNSPLVFQVMVDLCGLADKNVGWESFWGFKIVREIERSGAFPSNEEPDADYVDFMQNARSFISRHNKRLKGEPIDESTVTLLSKTHAEYDRCEAMGPFSKREVDKIFGAGQWACTLRFITWSSGRYREIDSGLASGHNRGTKLHEKIACPDTSTADVYVKCQKMIWMEMDPALRSETFTPTGSTEDMKRAYRQVAVCPSHQCFNVTAMPYMKTTRYSVIHSLVFGLRSAVVAFNRVALACTILCRRWFGLMITNYFDDFLQMELEQYCYVAKQIFYLTMSIMGWFVDPVKGVPGSCVFKWLGIWKQVSDEKIVSYICADRRANLIDMIEGFIDRNLFTSADAETLLGKFGFASTTVYGKAGRIIHWALQERVQSDETAVTAQILEAFFYLLELIDMMGAAHTVFDHEDRPYVVLFSDASSEETRAMSNARSRVEKSKLLESGEVGRIVKLGWVGYEYGSEREIEGTVDVCDDDIRRWKKKQPIAIAETLGAICAVKDAVNGRKNVDVMIYVDNQAAEMALRKGSSGDATMAILAHELHRYCAENGVRLWSSYVASALNPADEPSRDGTVNGAKATVRQTSEFVDLASVDARIRARGGRFAKLLL